MPKILFLRKKVKPSEEYSWYLLQFSHYCDDGFEKRRLFKGSEKRERKSPPCTCTRGATNWRLTIIMIIYLASISREVKCETVTEIRYDVRCHSSNCAIKEIRWRWYKNYRKPIFFSRIFTKIYFLGGISTILGGFCGYFGRVPWR